MTAGLFFMLPFLLQGALMFVDEVFFHQQRGLPFWERVGHPIDTCSVILCYLLAMFLPLDSFGIKVYCLAAFFSCALITKDEWVHQQKCKPMEQWVHSLLFILHPMVLCNIFVLGFLKNYKLAQQPILFFENFRGLEILLPYLLALTTVVLLQQIIYWNVPWKKLFSKKLSTTKSITN